MQVKDFLNSKLSSNIRYILYAFVVVLLVLGVVRLKDSFFPEPQAIVSEPDCFHEIQKNKKIVALTLHSKSTYLIYKGQPLGFEYELINNYAKSIGADLEVKIVATRSNLIDSLKAGVGDIIAFGLSPGELKRNNLLFSTTITNEDLVLIQRINVDKQLKYNPKIEDIYDLASKTITVKENSQAYLRLRNIESEISDSIHIVVVGDSVNADRLIEKVSLGEIDYTVVDRNIANYNQLYYDNLDVSTAISLTLRQAWAFRNSSPLLQESFNNWFESLQRRGFYSQIYNKYFNNTKRQRDMFQSDFYSHNTENSISVYDPLIKKHAEEIGWDWRLLASIIYQESKFNENIRSRQGSIGLMQMNPSTADIFGDYNLYDPNQNIEAGCKHIKYIEDKFKKYKAEPLERMKFAIASRNIGMGHILDAIALAGKHGLDSLKWDGNVEQMLLAKSRYEYYSDPVVKSGYVIGTQTVYHVKEIMARYNGYLQLIKP